jgi:homospermidine synthase
MSQTKSLISFGSITSCTFSSSVTKKTTKKDKIVAIDFDWTKVGENVQKNAEQISKNIMKNAETIGNNVARNSKAVGDRMSAYLNRNL